MFVLRPYLGHFLFAWFWPLADAVSRSVSAYKASPTINYQRVIMKWLGFYPRRNWDSNDLGVSFWDSESGGMHTKSGLIFVRKTMNNYWIFRGFTMFYPPSSGKLRTFQWKNMKKQSLQDEDRSYIFRMSERLQSITWTIQVFAYGLKTVRAF